MSKEISMSIVAEINTYIESQPLAKRNDLQTLHQLIIKILPKGQLWFLDGKNSEGKVVTNPNIGYGKLQLNYADGKSRDFYQIGLSANTTGISVYIMGLKDKTYLPKTYGKNIGKASVTGYCLKFKSLNEINISVLETAIKDGLVQTT